MFDVLAIDWGEKRFGVAFGDSTSQLILPASYSCNANEVWEILDRELHERNIQVIVVGRPANFQQQATLTTNLVDDFVFKLKSVFHELKIETVNERGSTKEFLGQFVDKQQLNHLAATKILEYYFGLESN